MIEQKAVWIFWDAATLKNAKTLDDLLKCGWIVSRVDSLNDDSWPSTLIYILEKETDDGSHS